MLQEKKKSNMIIIGLESNDQKIAVHIDRGVYRITLEV